ncbi:polysaccharide pyruvyl transferase family protein [Sphingobacterium alkalisoli]|uniref:Polysaccharide pyruvyl transferase family protein n=1 Tax=Sphingobacterium alkalisoli TaxID=1874115 RepID=A0A4U0GUH3_9SPHI|nr:polysaccharide pyruvyl transferase family protein [Sphingobacterium alkalisoli]TJY61362.1 polysaccharide pyruvyl transferase family protein [Sphingobacterium alkalisoli]GGH30733.1 hypothetical protein GCM10011418_43020 [Sphingobacterium alkalisoli]
MEIGILTFHRAHNYGAVLQLFGLYKYLESKGHSVSVLDYWPTYREGQYSLVSTKIYKDPAKDIKSKTAYIVKDGVTFFEKFIKWKKFQNFIKDFQHINFDQVSSDTLKLDVIFFGSDQIWRHNNFGFDSKYFGAFDTSAIKVSYAASMGIENVSEEANSELRNLVRNIDSISVRESTLEKKLKDLGVSDVLQVLDPVFLLHRRQWIEFFPEIERRNKRKYLLFYNLLNDLQSKKRAIQLCKENSWRFVEIHGDVKPFRWIMGVKTTTGPVDFLKLVNNAEFVVTSSFHGVAFSILFNKQFLACGFGANSSRVKSLLNLLMINDRHLDENSDFKDVEIEYSLVNNRIDELVFKSKNFIDGSILFGN